MACRMFGAKPLPEPMLVYCQLESWQQVSVKFESEFYHFHSRKCIWKFQWNLNQHSIIFIQKMHLKISVKFESEFYHFHSRKCIWKFQWNLNQHSIIFIPENAFENVVCQMVAILSKGRWVKWSWREIACTARERFMLILAMMTSLNGNIFSVTGPLCGEFTGPRWIPRTKASDAELWCFLWSTPE